jgi:heme a synthase
MVHVFAVVVAASTLILILAGGFVTSTGSGLAVPDWPNTYGWFMFAFPLEKMVGGIFWEHGHRLIASTVGFLILVLAFWLWRVEPRRWVRRLGFTAVGAVIAQGLLGGLTVLFFLPKPISISHAALAQLVFCLTVTIALVTSRGWKRGYAESTSDDHRLQRMAIAMTVLVYLQIIAGATMRHNGAGLAIPDFPLAFGGLLPSHWDPKIAIHFAHRVGAVLVAIVVLATTVRVFKSESPRRELVRPAMLLIALLCLQITLGAFVIWSGKHVVINSMHVAGGASVLGTSLVLALRLHRARFGEMAQMASKVAA